MIIVNLSIIKECHLANFFIHFHTDEHYGRVLHWIIVFIVKMFRNCTDVDL
jgi:hypothetical protein